MAGVLAAGEGAVLSHLAAAKLWNVTRRGAAQPEVLTLRRRRPITGVRVHHTRSLPPDEVTVRDNIPVTILERTIIDLADVLGVNELVNVLREAAYHHQLSLPRLREMMERHSTRAGAPRMVRAVELHGAGSAGTMSRLEDRFQALLRAAGIEEPLVGVKIRVPGREIMVDCLWPRAKLVVEVDGRAHAHPSVKAEDARRDEQLRAAGFTVIRVGWAAIANGAPRALREIAAFLARA
jgi:very-short-patch-repair endonuclease